jgi:hypothetical protein
VKDSLVLGVTPRPEFVLFFDLAYSEFQTKLRTGNPDGPTIPYLHHDNIQARGTMKGKVGEFRPTLLKLLPGSTQLGRIL